MRSEEEPTRDKSQENTPNRLGEIHVPGEFPKYSRSVVNLASTPFQDTYALRQRILGGIPLGRENNSAHSFKFSRGCTSGSSALNHYDVSRNATYTGQSYLTSRIPHAVVSPDSCRWVRNVKYLPIQNEWNAARVGTGGEFEESYFEFRQFLRDNDRARQNRERGISRRIDSVAQPERTGAAKERRVEIAKLEAGLGVFREFRDAASATLLKTNSPRDGECQINTLSSVARVPWEVRKAMNHIATSLKTVELKPGTQLDASHKGVPRDVAFEPLSEADWKLLGLIFTREGKRKPTDRTSDQVLARGFGPRGPPADHAEVTLRDMITLERGQWINDNVINFYLGLLRQREVSSSGSSTQRACEREKAGNNFFWNTFFLNKLYKDTGTYDFNGVRRWTRKVDLFSFDRVIFPVHQDVHWVLAVANIKQQRFEYFDSMFGEDRACLNMITRYFADESIDKKIYIGRTVSDWPHVFVKNIPVQRNGYDCGIFMLKNADLIARGVEDLDKVYEQSNMDFFRLRISADILRGSVHDLA